MNCFDLRAKSILTAFAPPTPQEAAQWAIDPFDADKRYRGTLLLANAYRPYRSNTVTLRMTYLW